MIDFGSLVSQEKKPFEYNLLSLYASLDVKSTHTEPRSSQKEAMIALAERHEDKDIVLKISTGAGKTTVGLLYLLGHMRKSRGPGVYLCPTIQLVEQVLQEATKLGINAYHYASGERHPDPACMRGEAVLVCTYEKLFNSKTTFSRQDVNLIPNAIVLDDAHAGAEIVRKQFTLQVKDYAYIELRNIIASQCRTYHPTRWQDIESNDPLALFEVPHWIWSELADTVRLTLHKYADEPSFRFVWPLVEDNLKLSRCVLNSDHAEISAEILPVDMIRPYKNAQHRLFMSATLADDSLLVRELGLDPTASKKPILPPSDQGLGERMIIAPALVSTELDREYLMQLCRDISATHNVVVLTSSEAVGKDWENYGARFFSGDEFSAAVKELKNPYSNLKFAVFAQRYDGVDLADDACRVLVLDSVPYGENLVDKIDAQMVFTPGGVRNKTIYRIEQGMGRAVRSHADYAVALLVGQDLATYVGRTEVLKAMTSETRAQLNLSIELAELIKRNSSSDSKSALRQVINQCLTRDEGWKSFYNSRIRNTNRTNNEVDVTKITLAFEERECHLMAASNRATDAIPRFQKALNEAGIKEEELGIYLQRLSRIAYLSDPVQAMSIQQSARQYCRAVALPPAAPRKPLNPGSKTGAENICAWFRDFSQPNAAVIEASKMIGNLEYSRNYRDVEKSIHLLGIAIGADSSLPETEFSEGPDVVWFWGDKMYVIEVKSGNQHSLHKSDSGQLHDSLKWAIDNFPAYKGRIIPITAANVTKVDADAHYPDDTRILTEAGCKALAHGLHQMAIKLAQQGPVFITPDNVSKASLDFKLHPDQFLANHTCKPT